MVGRAALGDPWIFRAMRRVLASRYAAVGPADAPSSAGPSREERLALILRHGEEMHRRLGAAGIREMRKHLAWYSRGIPGAAAFRAELVKVSTIDEFRSAAGRFF
jgi:tRNA-dihydrouridine synthase